MDNLIINIKENLCTIITTITANKRMFAKAADQSPNSRALAVGLNAARYARIVAQKKAAAVAPLSK